MSKFLQETICAPQKQNSTSALTRVRSRDMQMAVCIVKSSKMQAMPHLLAHSMALRLRVCQLPGHARDVAGLGVQTGAVLLGLRRHRRPLRLELRHLCADA